jgi:hypothetical protein
LLTRGTTTSWRLAGSSTTKSSEGRDNQHKIENQIIEVDEHVVGRRRGSRRASQGTTNGKEATHSSDLAAGGDNAEGDRQPMSRSVSEARRFGRQGEETVAMARG